MTTATVPSAPSGIRRISFEHGEDRLEVRTQVLHRLRRERASRLRLELARAAVLFDLLPRALDRVLLCVQEMLDKHDELDFAPLIHAVPRPVFGRVEEPKLALPVPQHVGLEIGELADLADREELLYRMWCAHRAPPPPPPTPHCSGFSSRSMRSTRARCGDLPSNSTAATSRAIGSSTPCRSPSVTADRAVLTPSATEVRAESASSRRLPRPSSTPSE